MLAYRDKNPDGSVFRERYLNQKHVAVVTCRNVGPNSYEYLAETVGGKIWEIDKEAYDRIVSWMEGK